MRPFFFSKEPIRSSYVSKNNLTCVPNIMNDVMLYSRLDIDSIHVLLGGHDLESVNENELELRSVVKMVRHPKFESKTFNNDIAVLKFDDPVPFSRSIGPVCLPQSGCK